MRVSEPTRARPPKQMLCGIGTICFPRRRKTQGKRREDQLTTTTHAALYVCFFFYKVYSLWFWETTSKPNYNFVFQLYYRWGNFLSLFFFFTLPFTHCPIKIAGFFPSPKIILFSPLPQFPFSPLSLSLPLSFSIICTHCLVIPHKWFLVSPFFLLNWVHFINLDFVHFLLSFSHSPLDFL